VFVSISIDDFDGLNLRWEGREKAINALNAEMQLPGVVADLKKKVEFLEYLASEIEGRDEQYFQLYMSSLRSQLPIWAETVTERIRKATDFLFQKYMAPGSSSSSVPR
jgi:hypothetical protein